MKSSLGVSLFSLLAFAALSACSAVQTHVGLANAPRIDRPHLQDGLSHDVVANDRDSCERVGGQQADPMPYRIVACGKGGPAHDVVMPSVAMLQPSTVYAPSVLAPPPRVEPSQAWLSLAPSSACAGGFCEWKASPFASGGPSALPAWQFTPGASHSSLAVGCLPAPPGTWGDWPGLADLRALGCALPADRLVLVGPCRSGDSGWLCDPRMPATAE